MGSILTGVLLLLAASQLYWMWRGGVWLRRHVRSSLWRAVVGGTVLAVYILLGGYAFGWFGRGHTPTRLTPGDALFSAPFLWWVGSSVAAFLVAIAAGLVKWAVRQTPAIESLPRRRFLERGATLATAAPFVAGAYGILHGRLNLETTRRQIRLARLPKAFHGIRIAQLSDIHIGPFMTGEQIRQYVGIANAMKPDLAVLTGDFVTWDGSTAPAAVRALSGLKAPLGVFGCLGNHDAWARVEDTITRLFRTAGIRILRQQSAPIKAGNEAFTLLGIDYQRSGGPAGKLELIQPLISPERVNILLSHNPDTFDRAAEMGIDLSLAGHTHGGQISLEFISPDIAPSRLVTPYVAGWFGKPAGQQLYVNRGIGTVGVPIRLGAPPEITIFELVQA